MARRVASLLASLTVLALSIVSTTFVLLALTSKSWSRQDYYGGDPISYTDTWCSSHRSPFYRCGQVINNSTTDRSNCHIPDCNWYKPYGFGQTSCETVATDGTQTGTRADECQAVHYSGNLQIAASFFITLGLLLTLTMTVISLAFGAISGPSQASTAEPEAVRDADEAKNARHTHEARPKRTPSYLMSPATPYMTLLLLFCMYAGVFLQILAQYFGVIGLVTNATPTAADVAGTGQFLSSSTWVIDKGLSTYATVAWTSALVTAGLAGVVFRTPKFQKFI